MAKAPATRTPIAGAGDDDGERTSIEGHAVHRLDNLLGLLGRAQGEDSPYLESDKLSNHPQQSLILPQ